MTVSCSVLKKRSPREVVGNGVTSVDFVTVLTSSFGPCCPGKESEARTPCKTAGNDFAQTLQLTSQGLGVYLRCPPYGSGQTVTKCRPKDTEGGH